MVLESLYTNFGRAVKEKGLASFTLLSDDAIEMITGWTFEQIAEMYTPFGVRFLNSEVRAWDSLKKYDMVHALEEIIKRRRINPTSTNA
jgi:hypothetical protein